MKLFSILTLSNLILGAARERDFEALNLRGDKTITLPELAPKPGFEEVTIWQGSYGGRMGMKGSSKPGYYACGAELRYQGDNGDDDTSDDTAANGLKMMFCNYDRWRAQEEVEIYAGSWGKWKGMKMCPVDHYIIGAQVRYQDKSSALAYGYDDTALNGLQIECKKRDTDKTEMVMVYPGQWGDWKNKVSRPNKFVSKAEERYDEGTEDLGMEGIFFEMEIPSNGISQATPKAEWVSVSSGFDSYEVKTSMTFTEGTSVTTETSNSVSKTVSAGFEFSGVGASGEVSGTTSESIAKSMSSSFSKTHETTITVTCDQLKEAQNKVLWQWVISAPDDEWGPGYSCNSDHFMCTSGIKPKCPLGTCADTECQTCREEAVVELA